MIWNFSRFKIFVIGLMGLLMVYTTGISVLQGIKVFAPFVQIVLCFLLFNLIMVSLFFVFWGLEPIMPDLKLREGKKE